MKLFNFLIFIILISIISCSKDISSSNLTPTSNSTPEEGGVVVESVHDQPTCDTNPNYFWYRVEGRCRTKPTNNNECRNLAGSWVANPNSVGQNCCAVNNQPLICKVQ